MENAVQSTVEIGGRERIMAFDFNAYAAIEEKFDEHFLDLFNRIASAVKSGQLPRATDISIMIFAGLYAVDETITLREVRSWINLKNMNGIVAKLMEPFGVVRPPNDLAPYVPTPPAVAEAAVRALDLQPGDVFIDLGCGDGRMLDAVLSAQPDIGEVIGVEMNEGRFTQLRERINGHPKVTLLDSDINTLDADVISRANKVFAYLLTDSNERIRPMLERSLKPGSRVVSHHFEFQGWPLLKSETLTVEGSSMSPHPIYTYVR